MVELRDRRIIIDGKPSLLFAGEVHYYRLLRSEWEDRIRKTKDLGCNVVASYIPWLIHEPRDGEFDVTGRFRPENDVAAFIDLCAKHDLYFLARPGPFIMAEMKNEGIPFWVYKKHPEVLPETWKGEKVRSTTIDLLAPNFLKLAERWYGAIMPILANRLEPKGGNVIGVQLDNEIGMLSWVNNQPELTENILCDFSGWLIAKYGQDGARARFPFDLNDPSDRTKHLQNPTDEFGAAWLRDYGDYNRGRIARYVAALRAYAEAQGVKDVPFIINIHGTGSGRAIPFPIGIHHLYEAYSQAEGYLPGSDHYLGELRRENAADILVINAFMEATMRPEQPLSSLEFEVGTGDYGEQASIRHSAAAADFKARLSVAQGNRLLNYYLLAGGQNPMLLDKVGDGNDRVAFTGERHGFAAPISPEGVLDPTWHGLQKTTQRLNVWADKLADMDEERDGLSLAFVPDYYKTDFRQGDVMGRIVSELESARGPMEQLSRILAFTGFRYTAVDIQNRPLDPARTPGIAFAAARLLDAAHQTKLADYVEAGGRLFLFGSVPVQDLDLKPCTILMDRLGVKVGPDREASSKMHVSLTAEGFAKGRPEVRVWRAQTFASGGEPFLRTTDRGEACGIEARLGRGIASFLPANYPSHLPLFRSIFDRLGLRPGLRWEVPFDGVIVLSMANRDGERLFTIVNLDAEPKSLKIGENRDRLFGGDAIEIAARQALLMPVGMRLGPWTIEYSTVEFEARSERGFRVAPGNSGLVVLRGPEPRVRGGRLSQKDDLWVVRVDGTRAVSVSSS